MSLPSNKISFKNLFTDLRVDGEKISDFWRSWQLSQEFKQKIKVFNTVFVQEGDTWHSISEGIYGTRDLWWVLVLFNDVEDPFAIFFDDSVDDSIREMRIPREEDLNFLLNEIRRKRVQFEVEEDDEEVS